MGAGCYTQSRMAERGPELDVFALLRFTASENRTSRAGPSSVWAARPGASVSLPTRERRVARTLPIPCRWHTTRGTKSPRCSSAWRARLRGDQSSFFTTFQDAVRNNDLS